MCTSQLNSFIEYFPKNNRPEITGLQLFWKNEIYNLFTEFSEYILNKYDLRFGIPVWSSKYGWTYRIGKSGVYIINGIQIRQEGFVIDGILVDGHENYQSALNYFHDLYINKEAWFHKKIAEKNKQQIQRNKNRIKREQEELLNIKDKIIPEKYNIFRWPSKLDIIKLKHLYQMDAAGIHDNIIADEIGLVLYIRCKLGKEDMERMEQSIIRCHNCNANISGTSDFRECTCGYQYSFREYKRSYRKNNMPTGSAAKIFESFISNWEHAGIYNEKMLLIDSLIHEFHRSMISGTINRRVAINFMDGTRKNIENILNELAR